MDHTEELRALLRSLLADPEFQRDLERKEAEKWERFVRRMLGWDGVSEELSGNGDY